MFRRLWKAFKALFVTTKQLPVAKVEVEHDIIGARVQAQLARMDAVKKIDPLFLDIYQDDYGPTPALEKVVADPNYYGVILKATEGTYYSPGWFLNNWKIAKTVGGVRYGATWFRGAYHYLKFNEDGAKQADFFLGWVAKAGGWDKGDLWPIVDCELGNDGTNGGTRDTNQDATAAQIVACVTAFATRVKQVTGRKVMLYGSLAMAERNITSKMNCDGLWFPRYAATLPMEKYTQIGWSIDELVFWQFYGDGSGFLSGYPVVTPLGKQGDISVLTLPGGIPALVKSL